MTSGSAPALPAAELCTGCGCCAGICPAQCIRLTVNRAKTCIGPVIDESRCERCGRCTAVCPGTGWDAGLLAPETHGGDPVAFLGRVISCSTGCSLDDTIRVSSASGGIVTEILLFLLETGQVDGVIVSRMRPGAFPETETFIARSRDEVLSAQGSVYCPVPAGNVIAQVLRNPGRYAFVGLPCHIAGIRKAQQASTILRERIVCTIGLFCSRTPGFRATENLLADMGIQPEEVDRVAYRGGGHPGRLRVLLKDGTERSVDHLDPRYWGYTFQHFFQPSRCWLCHDHSAMLADVSCGDNWTGREPFRNDTRGSSIIVARTALMDTLLSRMAREKRILLAGISPEDLSASQDLQTKSDIAPRFRVMRILGRPVPENVPLADTRVKPLSVLREFPGYIRIRVGSGEAPGFLVRPYIALSYSLYRLMHHPVWTRVMHALRLTKTGISALIPERSPDPAAEGSRKKIVLTGGFGWKDIGDEAMPHGVILNLRHRIPDLDIVMLSPDPGQTEKFHHERAIRDPGFLSFELNDTAARKIRVGITTAVFLLAAVLQKHRIRLRLWPDARRVLDELDTAVLLFNNGGGNLNSIMPSELYKKCTLFLAAAILDKPIIISGQTIGPFLSRTDALYARICLDRADFISFRDRNTSRERLREIGVKRPFMTDAADDSMTIPALPREEALALLAAKAPRTWLESDHDRCVVMNLKGSMSAFQAGTESMDEGSVIALMARVSDWLIERYRVKIFYLPTDYSPGVDDRKMHRAIVSLMKNRSRVFCVEDEYDDSTLKGLISLAGFAIGSRYHFCVFAADMHVPFFGMAAGVYQRTKLKGLADLCEAPQAFFAHDLSPGNEDLLREALDRFFDEAGSIRRVLELRIPELERKSLLAIDRAEAILAQSDGETRPGPAREAPQ